VEKAASDTETHDIIRHDSDLRKHSKESFFKSPGELIPELPPKQTYSVDLKIFYNS
jgi:hypothetical protein